MKGKIVIGIGAILWVLILSYISFVSVNPFLNELMFFGGAMVVICIFGVGCDIMEKKKHKIDVFK
jgi:hypothetical protein